MDLTKLTIEALKGARPDLLEALVKEAEKAADVKSAVKIAEAAAAVKAESEKSAKDAADKVAEAQKKAELAEAAKAGDAKALSEQFRQEMNAGFSEQAKVIQTLREENFELKKRLDEKEVRERIQAKEGMIDRLLSESALPDEAKPSLFTEDLMRLRARKDAQGNVVTVEQSVRARIDDRKKLCAGGEAKVHGNGGGALTEAAKPANPIEEQVIVDEAFSRKYSRAYGMPLTPDNVLTEWRKRQAEEKAKAGARA